MTNSTDDARSGKAGVPEAAAKEPRIANPVEYADRATRRMMEQERVGHAIPPAPGDPDRQGGESSPPPARR